MGRVLGKLCGGSELAPPGKTLTLITHIEENPSREGKRKQEWSFITPFEN